MDNHPPQPPPPSSTANPSRAEAERLLGIAEKLLQTRDLSGSREFAMLAQETEPLLEGSDQILAITDVLLASERRVGNNNRHHDWYSILQSDRSSDIDSVKRNYRRLALLLHPDKNKFPLADAAFKLVADAWATLSDPATRRPYDVDLERFSSKVDLTKEKDKLPVRRGVAPRGGGGGGPQQAPTFWTACPYCYVLYEYARVFKECCLRCQNCDRAFHAAPIGSLPPIVPGKEAYYCCWGFFPLGFSLAKIKGGSTDGNVNANAAENNINNNNGDANANANPNGNNNNNNNQNSGFPNWMPAPGMFTPPVVPASQPAQGFNMNVNMNVNASGMSDGSGSAGGGGFVNAPSRMGIPGAKKRGRPRKNPLPA